MKRISFIFSIIGIIGFIMLQAGNRTTVANSKQDMLKLASVLKAENIIVSEWSLHAREKLEMVSSKQEFNDYVKQMTRKFPEWEWTISDKDQRVEASAVLANHGRQKEVIRILYTLTKQHGQAYTIYEIRGDAWDQESESFLINRLQVRLADIFRGNAAIFSCIKGEFNDNIVKALPINVNNLLHAFNAKEMEALKEDAFISVSAYSPLFSGTIKGKHDNMNLQLALRTQGLGGKTTVVVGTPIITIEY